MKKILFPATNRVHLARQKLLLSELKKHFEVDIQEYRSGYSKMDNCAIDISSHYRSVFAQSNYDLVIIRADRFEMLPIAMIAAYKGIPIAHIEGGDLSGAIDNKVRFAISSLADIHFPTNHDAVKRLKGMDKKNIYNYGSLDVEYAASLDNKFKNGVPYAVMCHHAMKGEYPDLIEKIIREEFIGEVIVIKSNSDNGESYGDKEFTPEEYIKRIANADLLIGNSSSFIKEASVFGTPVVLIGNRQQGRLRAGNIIDVSFNEGNIRGAIIQQLQKKKKPSLTYFQPHTAKNIALKIKEFLK